MFQYIKALRLIHKPLFLFIGLSLGLLSLSAQQIPDAPNQLVTDYTGVLSSNEIQILERKLLAFEDSTSSQIAVVLVKTTDGYDVADYAVRLAQKWGVGGKEHNNGVVLLAALDDRAVTIQTGYGMEGALPDIITYRIIQNEIKPSFSQQNYFAGLDKATDAIIAYTKGEYRADPKQEKEGEGGSVSIILIVIIVLIVFSIISKGKGGGGGRGGGRVMTGKGSSDIFWWTLLNNMGRGGSGGSGGFGGFGGGGGFGDGGGGFGGFGGGGFGGGGSSGNW